VAGRCLCPCIEVYTGNGTAGVPAHSFLNDTNTGMYGALADVLQFTAGGTERVRITSAGISTTGVVYTGNGTAAAPAHTFSGDTNTGMSSPYADAIGLSAGGTDRLRVTAAGVSVTGIVTATFFEGNGSRLTGITAGATTLAALTDTSITSPANNSLLRYSTGTSKWEDVPLQDGLGSTSMNVNWPDAIICDNGTQKSIVYLGYDNFSGYTYYYHPGGAASYPYLGFNKTTGAYYTNGSLAGYDCINKSVATLYSEGKAFNFLGEAGINACPAGFTSIAAAGRSLGCMQTAENSAATWPVANSACFTTYGGRLPTSSEWHIAVANFTLTGETGDWEWLADTVGESNPYDNHAVAGNTSITDFSWNTDTAGSYAYRCFLPN
jgi:hypothetical protein